MSLPEPFSGWFASRGWQPRAHQLALIEADRAGESVLLIAPTGAGKTLAGFLPSLLRLAADPTPRLDTLYISPLKALAVDVHRNLLEPVAEMALPVSAETRTGDTPHAKRQRQRKSPPHMLLTTPESLALLISYADAPEIFRHLKCIIVDELHAVTGSKRGDLLALGLARVAKLAPEARRIGLSATVAFPDALSAFLSTDARSDDPRVRRVVLKGGAKPEIAILRTKEETPWAGHMAHHAIPEIYEQIRKHTTTIVFVNTRAQAEIAFQGLWRMNSDNLAIGIHHGSLEPEQRRKVEAAMARGALKAVVATSSLDLGIDWGGVDLVIQMGAPKGASRLFQRIGRANHRLDEPSRALLVPGNRFEALECQAAIDAVMQGELDGDPPKTGGLDVLAQHLVGLACSQPFAADDVYREVVGAAPYKSLLRSDFDAVLDFVSTGGYALKAYERYKRLRKTPEGKWRIANPAMARRYRMNIGTIVEAVTVKVKLRRGPVLGEVEEYFINTLTPGDTFIFGGRLLAFEGLRETWAEVTPASGGEPMVPAYEGGRLPLTTHLAERVRAMLEDSSIWPTLPKAVEDWLDLQRWRSVLPRQGELLVESFPRGGKEFLCLYAFEGRNAHQTLGMLVTRRMERLGLKPLGFVATDYVLAVWSLKEVQDMDALLDKDMLGDDLESWLAESSLMKRTFRNVAVIAGLVERRYPGKAKSGRQVTVNTDLVYDVLRRHDPQHILLRATRADAATGLLDVRRLADFLVRVEGKIRHRRLDRVSPLAVPAMLDIGKERVDGAGVDDLWDEAAEALIAEVMDPRPQGKLPL
ncbi:MAG: ligase-associated DNA damage response DEXH box helicase [Alphaproteobacteria bacterium]|nr:ligase-associated DNA damage response DEXH box helicase [Alphaproteobacteria bacterium]